MTDRQPNIALVVLDTLRYDHFDRYFNWLPGKRFTSAYSTANWTIPAHASLFTGAYPSEVGVHSRSRTLDDWESALPAVLRDHGYRTTMYTANPNLSALPGWADGFDVVRGASEFDIISEQGSIDWSGRVSVTDPMDPGFYLEVLTALKDTIGTDYSTLASLREGWARTRRDYRDGGARALPETLEAATFEERAEFLYVNLMDCHVPYHPPADYRPGDGPVETNSWEPFAGGVTNLAEIQAAYRACTRYLSEAFETAFELLRRVFDYVLVTSDHGELLGEQGLVGHVYGLSPELTRIPLVIDGPGLDERPVADPVSLQDVHATVLDLAGVTPESHGQSPSHGQSLVSERTPSAFLTEYQGLPMGVGKRFRENGVSEARCAELNVPLFGYVSEDGTYVYDTHDDGVRLDGPDPVDNHHETRLRRLVSETNVQPVTEASHEEVSPELRQQLEDLGYV